MKIIIIDWLKRGILKKLTGGIGKVEVFDNKIVCYVKQNLLDKVAKSEKRGYKIILNDIDSFLEDDRKLMYVFDLDKPLYYVFDNIIFEDGLQFNSGYVHVIFKNCTFHENIGIMWAYDVTFENNKYIDTSLLYYYGNCFLSGTVVNLWFLNDNFKNNIYTKDTNFGMFVTADKLEFVNSKVKIDSVGGMDIVAKEIGFVNSDIDSSNVLIEYDSVSIINSKVVTSKYCSIGKFCNNSFDAEEKLEDENVYNGIDSQRVEKVLSKVKK